MSIPMPRVHDRIGRLQWHRSVGAFTQSLDASAGAIAQRVNAIEREANNADAVYGWLVAQAMQALPELAMLDTLLASVNRNHQTSAGEIARLCEQWWTLRQMLTSTAEQCRVAAESLTQQTQTLARRLEAQRATVDQPLCEEFVRRANNVNYHVNANASCSVCCESDIPFCVSFARQCHAIETTPALRCGEHECRCNFLDDSGLVCLKCALRHLYHGAGGGLRSFVQCMRCNAQVCIHDLKLFRVTKRASPRLSKRSAMCSA